jgi:hypothetical protein
MLTKFLRILHRIILLRTHIAYQIKPLSRSFIGFVQFLGYDVVIIS